MSLKDFLCPRENVKFQSTNEIIFGEKKYKVVITDMRLILYAQRGRFSKTDDIISEQIDKINGVEYFEKGFLFRRAKITVVGKSKIDIFGSAEELKLLYHMLQSFMNV